MKSLYSYIIKKISVGLVLSLILTGFVLVTGIRVSAEPAIDYEKLFDSHQSIMLIIHAESGEIEYANQSAFEFYKYPDLLDMSINEINQLTAEEADQERMLAVSQERNYFIFHHRLADGRIREVEVRSYPFQSNGESFLYSIINDRTQLAQMESKNQRLIVAVVMAVSLLAIFFLRSWLKTKRLLKTIRDKNQELESIVNYDDLTKLYNRSYFNRHLNDVDWDRNYPIGLIMMDVNGLKLINDAYGNLGGDRVLRKVADALKDLLEPYGMLARIGGDEFALITVKKDRYFLDELKEDVQREVGELKYRNISISIAVGISLKKCSKKSINELFREAETEMYRRKVIDGRSMLNSAIRGILETLTEKYKEEKLHSKRVSQLSMEMGQALMLPKDDVDELEMAGMLHDIGKISIPDNILDKPGKLTDEEYEVMKEHTQTGYQILRTADEFSDLGIYALTHHEKYDGSGYPDGLKGEKIPLFSRIITIIDAYEAMTSDRSYRKAMSKETAIEELNRFSGTQFDPKLVEVFLERVLPFEEL